VLGCFWAGIQSVFIHFFARADFCLAGSADPAHCPAAQERGSEGEGDADLVLCYCSDTTAVLLWLQLATPLFFFFSIFLFYVDCLTLGDYLVSVLFLIKCNGVLKVCTVVRTCSLVHVCVLSLAPALRVAPQVNEWQPGNVWHGVLLTAGFSLCFDESDFDVLNREQ